jgi:hypothetical protein
MKAIAKIIAYLVWFGFSLALSFLFFRLVVWIEDRAGIFSGMRFWIVLVAWFGFVILIAWFPVWLMKRKNLDPTRLVAKVATFLITLFACLILGAIIWQILLPGKVYNCTDDNIFGFLRPGDWVHGNYVTVPEINPGDSMEKPDSIKEGWSVLKLWFLWWAFILMSIGISSTFLLFSWRNSKTAQTISP